MRRIGLAAVFWVWASFVHASPVARLDAGWIEGVQTGGVRAFLGLPYAQPPVGDLRWQAPRSASPWPGMRSASPPALAVGGMSGIGKSMGVKDFLRKHKPRRDKASGILFVPVLYLEYPPVAGTHWYLKALFQGLGYKSIIPQHTSDAFALLLTRLALARTRLIICEEVHQICGSRLDVIREWYGITRWLMNQSKIPQVLVATEEMFDLLDGDIQLVRRFDRLELAPWDNGPELAGFAKGYLRTVPLPEETVITSGLLDQIYETGQGIPDTTVKVLNRAAKKAMVAACSRILPEHIAADATLAAPVVTGRKAVPRYKRRPKSLD